MKRRVVFRGRSRTTGEWLYGCLVGGLFCSCDNDLLYIIDSNKRNYNSWQDIIEHMDEFEVVNNTVGQLTNITDIHGEDIWEKYLVFQRSLYEDEDFNITGVVAFAKGQWCIFSPEGESPLWSENRINEKLKV